MNEEDLSDIMKKITSMMNSNNSEDSATSTTSESTSTTDSSFSDNTTRSNTSESSNFNIDIETLLKMKNVMDKMNNNQNDPRSNLLLSLKPYLKESRKDKLDQYVKLLNMSNIIELFKPNDSNLRR